MTQNVKMMKKLEKVEQLWKKVEHIFLKMEKIGTSLKTWNKRVSYPPKVIAASKLLRKLIKQHHSGPFWTKSSWHREDPRVVPHRRGRFEYASLDGDPEIWRSPGVDSVGF